MAYFPYFLVFHSWIRWMALLLLVLALGRNYIGWFKNKRWAYWDKWLNIALLIVLYIQLGIGLNLYFHSPMVTYFLEHAKASMANTQLRFFGMEHITAMSLSILMITWAYYRGTKEVNASKRFRSLALWYSVAFIIIFLSIPWSFSPFTARPDFRLF